MASIPFMQCARWLGIFVNVSFLLLFSYLAARLYSLNSGFVHDFTSLTSADSSQAIDSNVGCKGIHKFSDNQGKCWYVKSYGGCQPIGYIFYLQLFYCVFSPVLGYTGLAIWLVLLFYLLGDTASNYFCPSLDGLSRTLNLSPTVAGVTLLSLGNGAPDIFASVISFTSNSTIDIGLNSVLGGAFCVSNLVVGIICISVSHYDRRINRSSFIRNVLMLIFCLSCLLVIVVVGKINLWGALSFLSLYFIYVFFLFTSEKCENENGTEKSDDFSRINQEGLCDLEAPLLDSVANKTPYLSDQGDCAAAEQQRRFRCHFPPTATSCLHKVLCIIAQPLYLPRKMTIPLVSEQKWSKPFAVVSITLAPILMAFVWSLNSPESRLLILTIGGSVGITSGSIAFCTTDRLRPPKRWLFLWLVEGFIMSILWTYILAQELISLLESLGAILGINHSILGFTVLAWGNSLGDLVANVTMAKNAGPSGAQVAISACYAGPLFNTLVGLGLSFTLSAWKKYPEFYLIPSDHSVYETIGFCMVGLLWGVVIIPRQKMRLHRVAGGGLLAIYLGFLLVKMASSFGLVQLVQP